MRIGVVLALFSISSYFALEFGTGGLWKGLAAAHAVTQSSNDNYDLTHLTAVRETLKKIQRRYVDPERMQPRQMFLSALNQVQREVAQVIVLHEAQSTQVTVQVDTERKEFRVDNVQGPWDVAARLREVFAFLQKHLKNTDVELREVEYAACNGLLRTLDPHSVFLSPEAYGEMTLSTSGHFGGLGIVISIRDQMLTIMRPMPGTPAGRAGLQRLDRILKIDNESTMNMPLDDAVKRLRGKADSKVTIWIHRDGKKGWSGIRPFELRREQIRIRSVTSKVLSPGIGYVRLKQFQSSSSDELDEALQRFKSQGKLKGLVLDLRGNPGGLLDQAAKVTDRFISRGVIVSTVGGAESREEKRAHQNGTEPPYPIVVLVNPSSASASEIVSGALKNHDRAVLVGQTTFGKGTVQLVFPRVAEGAALKLTIAQYLTPGDVSIQGVGVTPDIELAPITADTLEMNLFRSEHRPRERDLSKSLSYHSIRNTDRPWRVVRYNLPESERKTLRALGGDVDDKFRLDFPIRFARDLVGRMPRGRRTDQLEKVAAFIEEEQAAQTKAVSAELKALGIDWSPAPKGVSDGPKAGQYTVKVGTNRAKDEVIAGDSMDLEVSVTNTSDKAVYRLRAITKSDNASYDEQELIFGRVAPGETRSAKVALGRCYTKGRKPGSTKPLPLDAKRVCSMPKNSILRQDVVKIRFSAGLGEAPPDAEIRPTVKALSPPSFAYTYQISDNRPGNGDGQIERGEGVTLYLSIKNAGKGPSQETQALIRNLTGNGLYLRDGRFDVSHMKPGETREVAFTFDVLPALKEDTVKVEISVVDRDLGVVSNEKIRIPISEASFFVKKAKGRVEVTAAALVRPQPQKVSQAFGKMSAGSVAESLGTFAEFTKVSLGNERFGFVETARLKPSIRPAAPLLELSMSRSPPALEVAAAALSTRQNSIRIHGVASDGDQVLDMYMFVGPRKVFYHSNRKATDPRRMSFDETVPLRPGTNIITVVTRENEDIATAHTLVVRRDGAKGGALPTPRRELFGADWEFTTP